MLHRVAERQAMPRRHARCMPAPGYSTSLTAPARRCAVVSCTALLAGCAPAPLSILDPVGPGSAGIASIGWIMFAAAVALWVLVMALALYATFGPRFRPVPSTLLLVGGGLMLPVACLTLLLVQGARTGYALLPDPADEPWRVHVHAHQWWWEVRYPVDGGLLLHSANEVHIPVGRPVDVYVTSEDVIHSFWAPRLGRKIDAVPRRVNVVRIQADAVGIYDGTCSEFCGAQHARMQLKIVAHDGESLARRLAFLTPMELADTQPGAQAFKRHCLRCHALDPGLASSGSVAAPNLGDLYLRERLAGGTLPNTPENLRAWIRSPQMFKPGARMPDLGLDTQEVEHIATFLERREP